MRNITSIVVHCTASPDHLDVGFHEINAWHKERGWMSASGISCGYHYIIRRNGIVERGRPDSEAGAHARGVNGASLGVVWVGTNEMTKKQFKALVGLLHMKRGEYKINIDNVMGHKEAVKTDKTCPNIDMNKIRAELIFVREPVKVRGDK